MIRPLMSSEELSGLEKGNAVQTDSTLLQKEALPEVVKAELPEESPYKINESQTHIFVIALSPSEVEEAKNLLRDLENFHKQSFANSRLRTGNMNINPENSIYIISPFANAEKAKEYYSKFSEEFKSVGLSPEAKARAFFISIENFQTLNRTKNLEEYLFFFRTTYQ